MRRPTAGQQDFAVYDFSGGLNVKSAPQELADNELSTALNGYLRPDGGFEMRRGISLYNTLPVTTPVLGLYRFTQSVRSGNEVTFKQTLAQANNFLWDADSKVQIGPIGNDTKATTQSWTVVTISDPQANPLNLALPVDSNGNPIPLSGFLTDVAVICVGGHSGPYIYDGANPPYHPSGWANAHGAKWCQAVNGVLWFGGIDKFPNQVMACGTGIAPDVSFEKIAGYAIFDLGQPVMGLSIVGAGAQAMLTVGLPTGLALIYGTGPGNYTVQMVPMDNDGVASGQSMQSNNGTVFFLGNNNAYSFNPLTTATPQPLSLKVQPWITEDPFTTGYPMNGTRGLFFSFIYYDRYHIVYSSAIANQLDTVLVYDTNVQGWTVLTLGVALNDSALIDGPFDPAPVQCLVGGNNGRIYQWDEYVGFQDALWNSCSWDSAIWDDNTTNLDLGAVIPAWMATKYFKVGEPGSVKTLHRMYPEIIYPSTFGGALTVQTDYGAEGIFSANVFAMPQSGALWDQAMWDSAIWNSFPPARASWNAPASRIDITTQVPSFLQPLVWNTNTWNNFYWAPVPPENAPGIQAEAFSFGVQSGFSTGGGVWDMSQWDNATWGQFGQLPWVVSGFTGSFAQGGKR